MRVTEILFLLSWITAGGSLGEIFDGGAPAFAISMLVLLGTAYIITRND